MVGVKGRSGAKIGNQHAKGSTTSGRPPEIDWNKEAEDIDEWSKKPGSKSLYEFAFDKRYLASEMSDVATRHSVFGKAYSKAKERLAVRRAEGLAKGTIHPSDYNRSIRAYDNIGNMCVRDEKLEDVEMQIKVIEAKIKLAADAGREVDPEIAMQYVNLVNQISSLRSSSSTKIDKRRISEETKSK